MAQVQLRGGPGGPPPKIVARVQRDRLYRALAEVSAERGYAATTVAHVLQRARISRRTFYTLFDDKEECLLAAYNEAMDDAFEAVAGGCTSNNGLGPAERIRHGARVLAERCRDEPAVAGLCVVEILGAGPAGQAARMQSTDRFVALLEPLLRDLGYDDGSIGLQTRALVGILNEAIYDRLSRHDVEGLPDLVDEMIDAQVRQATG
jgi:AcrR family transcriptional regulator